MTVDHDSPAGAWEREWDRRSHTPAEYRREIYELRERIHGYVVEIERLKAELVLLQARDSRWVQEP